MRRRDALNRQAPKHRIDSLGRQLGPAIKPPGHHGHEGANDVLHDKFARDSIHGLPVNGRGKLVAYQIGEYAANGAKSNGTVAAANQRSVEVNMVRGMLEHGQAEAQAAVPDVAWLRQGILLPVHEQPAQMFEAAPSQIILARIVGVERRSTDIGRLADVFDSDRLLAFFKDQRDMGLLQHRLGAGDAAVYRRLCHFHTIPGQIERIVS